MNKENLSHEVLLEELASKSIEIQKLRGDLSSPDIYKKRIAEIKIDKILRDVLILRLEHKELE